MRILKRIWESISRASAEPAPCEEKAEPIPAWAQLMKIQVQQMMKQKQRELEERMAQPGYSEWVAEENRKYFEREKGRK